ncbi:hypothetical protein Q9L58_004055 [Maublancomyces gigas]|uniref:F-box domain-containing protein n=1 Tax=Discina gigas TaxID=1032678 RepID=A0ABR3GM04_9PEZI
MTPISFVSLPNEMILQIASDTDDSSLLSLILCSRSLYNLLEPVLDIRAMAPRGDLSAMQWAAVRGYLGLVHRLIMHDVHPDTGATDTEPPAVRHAVEARNLQMVELLIIFGADINSLSYKICGNEAVIHVAAANGDSDMIELLVSYGANISANLDEIYDRTPLYVAVWNGHVSAVQTLLELGADVYEDGDSELLVEIAESVACSEVGATGLWDRMAKIGELLVQAGADVREVSSSDRFPDAPRNVEFLGIMVAAQQRATWGA